MLETSVCHASRCGESQVHGICRLACPSSVASMERMRGFWQFHNLWVLPADAPREERNVLRRIKEALDDVPDLSKCPDRAILSVQSALDEQQPEIDTERRISLTW